MLKDNKMANVNFVFVTYSDVGLNCPTLECFENWTDVSALIDFVLFPSAQLTSVVRFVLCIWNSNMMQTKWQWLHTAIFVWFPCSQWTKRLKRFTIVLRKWNSVFLSPIVRVIEVHVFTVSGADQANDDPAIVEMALRHTCGAKLKFSFKCFSRCVGNIKNMV